MSLKYKSVGFGTSTASASVRIPPEFFLNGRTARVSWGVRYDYTGHMAYLVLQAAGRMACEWGKAYP